MKNNPLISVIITCHNQDSVISKAINSVLEQSYTNWECIIVDDGSTDNSADVINEIAKSDKRIKYLFQTKNGVASARNAGFDIARGAYIQFLDGDDLLHLEKLELQVEHFMTDETIDVSYTDHQFYLVEKNTFSTFKFDEIGEYPLEQFLYKWRDGVSLPVHAPIYKRTIWGDNELPYPSDYNERCEDWVFLVLIAQRKVRFAYYDKILCTYCFGESNFSNTSMDWYVAPILAAQYLEDKIPEKYRKDFVKKTIHRSIERYHQNKKAEVLHRSKNWQLGNFFTKPFFKVLRAAKKIIADLEN